MAYSKLKEENYKLMGGINVKASPYNNDVTEFRDLSNLNFVTVGSLSQRPGTSLYAGATVSGRITGGIEFNRLSGASYIVISANTNVYTATPSAITAFKTGVQNSLFDFKVFVDRMFACNGKEFFKYDGTNNSDFSLPNGITGFGVTSVIGGGLSGTYVASYGYLNDSGYLGPCSNGQTITLNGITFGSLKYYGLTAPSGFGVTGIQLYRTAPDSVFDFGTTLIGSGSTTFTDLGMSLSITPCPTSLYFTLAPRYLEIYNNQLFMAGFSNQLSTAVWSDVGMPESIQPEFFAEFRTNDGDRITGLKSYNGSLVVSKFLSFHRLTGDVPENFVLQEISDQYGCLSHRALVVWENVLWFLDSKGIVEYNGSNIKIVSNKVEDIFTRMNVEAARDNACGIHYREFNEVWFCIPIDGSTINNCILVYDYLSNAWTKYLGNDISTLFMSRGALGRLTPFFGGYTGNLLFFGPSLVTDYFGGITCKAVTPFISQLGQTSETQYRRFYLNVNPILDPNPTIRCNFYKNYGPTLITSVTFSPMPFQTRVDFGIPARSIQAEMIYSSATFPIKINGYSFVSRFQRDV